MATTQPIAELFDLREKVALVTGGALGIGQAIALRLAEAGAAVMIADINEAAAEETVELIIARGGKAAAVKANAALVRDAEIAAKTTVGTFGRLDILVNNAAIFPPAPMLELTEAQWDKVQSINLKGTFFFSQATAKAMIAAGTGGRIINIASIDAIHPTGSLAAYDASKGGVAMLTESMALELARHHILVNAIAPGGIATPGAAALGPEFAGAMERATGSLDSLTKAAPLGMGEPDDIAKVVLFLAGGAAADMTGSLVVVDGGLLLK
jgi:2-deoxy-D-gluconate 3-dehydrogenase